MDYKELLVKYMSLVIGRESVDYINHANDGYVSKAELSDHEIEELKNLSKLARELAG